MVCCGVFGLLPAPNIRGLSGRAGWGIGLIFHYIFEFNPSRLLSEEEEFKKMKRKMEEEKNLV